MTLTLDEITYLYELALNDNPPNMIFSNEKNIGMTIEQFVDVFLSQYVC